MTGSSRVKNLWDFLSSLPCSAHILDTRKLDPNRPRHCFSANEHLHANFLLPESEATATTAPRSLSRRCCRTIGEAPLRLRPLLSCRCRAKRGRDAGGESAGGSENRREGRKSLA